MTISKRTQYDHVLEVIEPVPGSGLRVMRCKVCGGVPATTFGARASGIEIARTLTRHCCGRMLTDDETSEIEEGLDFRDGQWTHTQIGICAPKHPESVIRLPHCIQLRARLGKQP